jgi:hypothetical protein
MVAAVWEFIEANPGCTQNLVFDGVTGKEKSKKAAIEILEREGSINIVEGPRRALLHSVTDTGRIKLGQAGDTE